MCGHGPIPPLLPDVLEQEKEDVAVPALWGYERIRIPAACDSLRVGQMTVSMAQQQAAVVARLTRKIKQLKARKADTDKLEQLREVLRYHLTRT